MNGWDFREFNDKELLKNYKGLLDSIKWIKEIANCDDEDTSYEDLLQYIDKQCDDIIDRYNLDFKK